IRFCDGRRVKVKTDWYLSIARIMADLTPIAVWEVMTGGKVPKEYLVSVPEELRPLAERYQAVLEGQYARVMLHIEETVRPLLERFASARPALGRFLDTRRQEWGYLRSAAFLVRHGKTDKL